MKGNFWASFRNLSTAGVVLIGIVFAICAVVLFTYGASVAIASDRTTRLPVPPPPPSLQEGVDYVLPAAEDVRVYTPPSLPPPPEPEFSVSFDGKG